jgi:hypothetical protein
MRKPNLHAGAGKYRACRDGSDSCEQHDAARGKNAPRFVDSGEIGHDQHLYWMAGTRGAALGG